MLISRGLSVLKLAKSLKPTNLQLVRKSHDWNYRTAPPPASRNIMFAAEGVAAFFWWWILWHLYTEPGHILGEFPYPDPRKWTNEELGVPPIE